MTKLSVLDQTPVIDGHSVADAIAATIDLAQLADDLGYTRYWCAEHHGLRAVADPAPEVMLARLGSITRRIRIGSGGIMLPYYSPFKVAEQFMMLEALFPGRVDLAVGRAPGGDLRTAQAVASGVYNRGEFFAQQVAELAGLFSGQVADDSLARGVLLQPSVPTRPQLWVLGSSDYGGSLAAQLGIRFAFAHFINAFFGHTVAHAYREQFRAGFEQRPYLATAVFVICADTEQEAADLERAVDLRRVQMARGLNGPIPTVAQALAQEYGEREQLVIDREKPRSIIGTAESVALRLRELCERFNADELIVLSVAPSYETRRRSYELLADTFELRCGDTQAPAPGSTS
jgi:luciferase family oxidoreductase group 1